MRKNKTTVLFGMVFGVLCLYILFLVVQLIWGLATSFRENLAFLENPFGVSGKWKLDNYVLAFDNIKKSVPDGQGAYKTVYIEDMVWNSLVYSVGCAFINTFVTCTVAYVVAKYDFKICRVIFNTVIVVMILPIVGSLPAEIRMTKLLNIYGTMGGMFIMRASFLGTYFFVFTAIYKGVPNDYMEAAYIDGASDFNVYINIMFPMVKNTFSTILLLSFIAYWNDYSIPLIYLPDRPPLALGLYEFNMSTTNAVSTVPAKMAGCFCVFIPIFVIFILFQDKLTGNLYMGGLKE
ncbi:MAG: carbohydrate ABC transporter permease [Candidatus Borkfalkiaceae bacterium]|nr:carbohydrate ABC transporter permease [Clostridia bacterium]MDY6222965.1 carbohydrate ABC transporter permease [Christensenellaceae bacterium]